MQDLTPNLDLRLEGTLEESLLEDTDDFLDEVGKLLEYRDDRLTGNCINASEAYVSKYGDLSIKMFPAG